MTQQEIKTCQNCKSSFHIDAQDFAFYEKMQVPAPTFCPKCRLQRRLSFFNLFRLYKRPCDLCKKDVISMYHPDAPYVVYCPSCWWSDNWDPLAYGREYDFSRPFFEQLKELWRAVPLLGLSLDVQTTKESPHNNHAGHLKNCYLLFHANLNEDCAYGFSLFHGKSVMDSSLIHSCEWLYDCMNCWKVNRGVGHRSQVTESVDCMFLRDCMNCQNCIASANLRNKRYYIFNQPYSKEDYQKEIAKLDFGSHKNYQEFKKKTEEHWKKYIPKPRFDERTANCSGNYVFQSKNCQECYEVVGAEDSKFLFLVTDAPIKDCYDVTSWGDNMQLVYEGSVVGEGVSRVLFCQESGINLRNAEYSKLSTGGAHHFGCVSVKKREYCILNKQYSKDDYEALRVKIMQHMNDMPYRDRIGAVYRYGEFFPIELSPFGYNETMAQNFFPLSGEDAQLRGYPWRKEGGRRYAVTVPADHLPDHIKDAPDTITREVIGCKKCGRGFRIISTELSFLRSMNVPLPRECPFCRIEEKFQQWVENLTMVMRTCDKCGVEFQTSYTQERASTVYCKKCYLAEVV